MTECETQTSARISFEAELKRTLSTLFDDGDIVELRAIYDKKIGVGYYDDSNALIEQVTQIEVQPRTKYQFYITFNEIRRDISVRLNTFTWGASATGDADIARRRWLVADFDPDRAATVSATDEEKERACETMILAIEWLTARGFPEPIKADSGNGYWLLYKVNIPADPETNDRELAKLFSRFLKTLNEKFSSPNVKIDQTVYNASRIMKLFGTTARKGKDTTARPHRMSRLLHVPCIVETVSRELIAEVADDEGQTDPEDVVFGEDDYGMRLDVHAWLEKHGIAIHKIKQESEGTRYVLDECPFDSTHDRDAAAWVLQFNNGAITAGCHHNRCKGKYSWSDLRQKYEPEMQRCADGVPNRQICRADATSGIITINGRQKELQLPPIPPMVIVDGPKTIEELLDVFHANLYIEEDYNVTGPVCAFLCNFLPHEPDIFGIVAPSGSIKTEMMRTFGETQNQYCYPISSITEHTFVSGLEKNVDTIPLLRGRAIVVKDLTTLLSKKEDIRSAVFADFREITDGYVHKEFGNGVKKEFHDIHSSILFACTPAIERYYSMYSTLGARMVFMRPQNDPIKARERSNQNQPRLKQIRKILQDSMLSFVDANVKRIMTGEQLPAMSYEIADEIGQYCDMLAWLRHPIHHDFKGRIDEIPDPEFPTRLMNTISKLTQMHAFVFRREAVNDDDLAFARRIVTDNIPTARAAMLQHMDDMWMSTPELGDVCGIGTDTLRTMLAELTALTVVEMRSRDNSADSEEIELSRRVNHYRIRQSWCSTLNRLRGVIRIGGGKEEVSSLENENECQQSDLHTYPQNVTPLSFDPELADDRHDPTRLAALIMIELRSLANDRRDTVVKTPGEILNGLAETIKSKYAKWCDYDVLSVIEQLAANDQHIQAIMADLTRGVVWKEKIVG